MATVVIRLQRPSWSHISVSASEPIPTQSTMSSGLRKLPSRTCQAGVNRSGLVTALVLLAEGWRPCQILEHLRACRSPHVLSNSDFRELVLRDGGASR